MKNLRYEWKDGDSRHALELVPVDGTEGCPYTFGEDSASRRIDIPGFFMATVSVTQALWTHVMEAESMPAVRRGTNLPLENVSWDEVTCSGGFLDRLNASSVRSEVTAQLPGGRGAFRLPTEAEWEYAARGGPHWRDGFRFVLSTVADAL